MAELLPMTGYGAPAPARDEAAKAAIELRNATARLVNTLSRASGTTVPGLLYSQSGCLDLKILAKWAHSCGYKVGWTLTDVDGDVYV